MTLIFEAVLAVWTACSVLRFIHMYDPTSLFQRWRRWDPLRLVPVGAFFSPGVPRVEHFILVRDRLLSGSTTGWRETPKILPRRWSHAVWNPQKHDYRAKSDAARALLSTAMAMSEDDGQLPPRLCLTDSYLRILRYVSALPRVENVSATQFVVIEVDLMTRSIVRYVMSAPHNVETSGDAR
jgi:hypothetical protein